ncbi:hypothetical protein [Pedobacter agri]|uniref:hypothetical protein n=1 Tax=Pedobacter agri TaxID=454586 RepID=UPI0002E1461B|nr:hypothetical protein [Pedobacter agri]
MKYLFLTGLFALALIRSSAQGNYDVAKIPEDLKRDAIVVIRNEEQFFDIKSLGSGQYDYKVAITILNKAGDDFAEMAEVYDKFSSVYNMKATLYDASRKKN